MGKNDFLYNTVSVVFLLLSVMVCLIALAWISGTINVPNALAPATDVPVPEVTPRITFTPSMTPTITNTPRPTSAPFMTWTPTLAPTETATTSPTTPAAIVTEEAGN